MPNLRAVKPRLVFAALSLVWGSAWIASSTLTETIPPLRASALRMMLAGLLCVPAVVCKRLPWPRGRALGFTLLLAATLVAFPFLLLWWAKPHVSSATITVLFAAMPLVVASLARGRVPQRAMQSMFVALGAVAWVVGASASWNQAEGATLAFAAVVCVGASSLVARRELAAVAPVMAAGVLTWCAGLILLAASLVLEKGTLWQWNVPAVAALVCLGAVAGAPAYAAYFWLLQQDEAWQVAALEWTQPLVALLESAFFLRQGFSWSMMAGSLITLVCVVFVLRAAPEDDNPVSLLGT